MCHSNVVTRVKMSAYANPFIQLATVLDATSEIATVCGVEWNLNAAAFTPQNGAVVRTDSVRTKAQLQNVETHMRNLHR